MQTSYADISAERPLVISSPEQFLAAVREVVHEAFGIIQQQAPAEEPELPDYEEMNTNQVREYLTQIGYKVSSHPGLMAVVGKLKHTKRGKLNYWKTEDIKKIIPRI